ncbi:MAG TPA: peroxiredoxin [Kofleriaceae bacterium]|nr:peroxiredoxin [Kofleriaceae bacterium]
MIEPGQKIPSIKIKKTNASTAEEVDVAQLFAGKKAVVFSLPGAFTPTCSQKHLPGFIQRANEIQGKGVDLIACLSVNDAFVMMAWAKDQGAGDNITMLADGAGELSKALGIEVTIPGMGLRARRGMMVFEDGVLKSIDMEQPGKLEVSSADACMLKL